MIRSAMHSILAFAATLVIAMTIAPVLLSAWLAVLAYRVCPNPGHSNCWAWAVNRAWTMTRAWRSEGMLRGWEPRMLLRWSRSAPRWLLHVLVGTPVERHSDELLLESFKPLLPDNARGWRTVLHLLFLGRVQQGDGHNSVPPT